MTRLDGNGPGPGGIGLSGGKTPGPGRTEPSREPPGREKLRRRGLRHFRLASSRRLSISSWDSEAQNNASSQPMPEDVCRRAELLQPSPTYP